MKTAALLSTTILVSLLLSGCSESAPDARAADAKAIKDLETQWNQDFAAKDAEKLAAHYADDGILMQPGMPAISTKVAIRRALIDMVADPALALKFEATRVEVAKSGDLAFTQGSYALTMTDPRSKQVVNDRGSYVTTYRKQADKSWKAVADIVTSEVPPAVAAPAPHVREKPKAKAKGKSKGRK
jgi:uncharacterized protein (TIGR02246 family)